VAGDGGAAGLLELEEGAFGVDPGGGVGVDELGLRVGGIPAA
jgi:hypothetical protein